MRRDGRKNFDLREITFLPDYVRNVPGSVLVEQGNTRVLCTATFDQKVPHFLKDSPKGWVSAEYGMLPGSVGNNRLNRERQKSNSRHIEIQRFIGRALRCTFNLHKIVGKTVTIDADVLQADGGTRCAAINGGMGALVKLLRHLVFEHMIPDLPAIEYIAAVSIGVKGQDILVDLNYEEDSTADADINIVSSEKGHVIEVQAFAEEHAIPSEVFSRVMEIGIEKNLEIIKKIKKIAEM